MASVEPGESGLQFPSVFPMYTVTRAQSRRMSTDLPVSECRKSGPTRSFDFEIETKKKKRRPKKRRPKEVGAPKRRSGT